MPELRRVKPSHIVKARIMGGETPPPNALQAPDEEQEAFTAAGALEPPYNPRDLIGLYERSAALQPNVTAYAVNIECFGYRLEPCLDLEASDANQKIREALMLERIFDEAPVAVSDDEVEAKRIEIEATMRLEKLQTELFFDNAVPDTSFISLRERTRIDYEVTGNAFWEVLRDEAEQITNLSYVPSSSTRLMKLDPGWVEIEQSQKISAIAYRRVKTKRRFRRYVQLVNGQEAIFFKEFGDPRLMSARTGRFYEREEDMKAREPGVPAATELIHFANHWPSSAYGVPRWIGTTLEVLGSRAAAEVNVMYFDNKAIPPMAILVSGGTLGADSVERIESYINTHIVGRANFHNIIVLEAEPAETADGTARNNVKIELRPLMDAQQKDANFLLYDRANTEKIGNSFRLPKLLRGDSADVNRSTAEAALEYAERQVFQPEREKIDHRINRGLFASMGVRFWKFVSNGPVTRNPIDLVDMVTKAVVANILTPGEARELLQEAFHVDFKKIEDTWVDQPIAMMTSGAVPPMAGNPGVGKVGLEQGTEKSQPGSIAKLAEDISILRQRLIAERDKLRASFSDLDAAKDATQVFRVPADEMRAMLAGDAA